MRLLAMGDIHGCFRAMQTLLDFVPFQPSDKLVCLGDYVDRGPQSREVVDWLIDAYLDDRCIPLRGNHEVMMVAAYKGQMKLQHWTGCGGDTTLESYRYPNSRPSLQNVPHAHWHFLENELRPFHQTDTHIFVHASLDPLLPMEEQPDSVIYWERFDWIAPHQSGKTIVCGHSSQVSGIPWNKGYAVCIDTWVYGDGYLTCLDVATGQYWQANEQGETRRGELEHPNGSPAASDPDFEVWQ